MAEDKVQLTVQINSDTGKLDVVGKQLQSVGEKAGKTESSFAGLSKGSGALMRSLLPLASATAVIAFFKNAVSAAEEQNESLRRLRGALNLTDEAWEAGRQQIVQWSQAVQGATRFAGSDAISAVERLSRTTGNLEQAQAAAQIAMDLSVKSGKDLAQTTKFLSDLISGQSLAIQMAQKDYAVFAGGAKDTQGILDALAVSTKNAALEEESLTKSKAQATNAFKQFSEQVGQTVMPAFALLTKAATGFLKVIDNVGSVIAGWAMMLWQQVNGVVKIAMAALKGDFREAIRIAKETANEMLQTAKDTGTQIVETWRNDETAKAEIVQQGANTRVQLNADALARIAEEERKQREKEEAERRAAQERIVLLEAELDQKLASLGQQTLQKKLEQLNLEVEARKRKIGKEVQDEVAKQRLLNKLNDYQVEQTRLAVETEVALKQMQSFQVADLAIQTFATLNAMTSKGTQAEVNRARAILALEKSIAIARAWAAAAGKGPAMAAIAAAQTALIVAQFAQQSRAIGDAAKAFDAGQVEARVSTPLPGGDTLERVFASGSEGGSGGGTVSSGRMSSAGGGGGGGGTVINVGGVSINFDVDKLSVDNVEAVMRAIVERTRQGTIEGVQLALQLSRTADKNSSLAV